MTAAQLLDNPWVAGSRVQVPRLRAPHPRPSSLARRARSCAAAPGCLSPSTATPAAAASCERVGVSGVEGLVRAWCVRVGVGRHWLVRAWCVRVGVGRHCLVQASSPCLGAAPRAPFFLSASAGCEPLLWRGWGFGCRSVTAQGQTGGRAEGVLLGPALHAVHRRAALPPPTAAPSTPGHSPHETRAHSQATRCTRPHPPHTRPHSPGPSEVAEGAGRHVPRPPARRRVAGGRGRSPESWCSTSPCSDRRPGAPGSCPTTGRPS